MSGTTETRRYYEEGNYGLYVFPLNSDGTYGTGYPVEGTVSIDITFTRTRTDTPADDRTDYLTRTSPEKGEGTLTLIGLKKADYKKLYNNITAYGDVGIVGGRKNQSKRLGICFFNTVNYESVTTGEGDPVTTIETSTNMFILPNVTFELPNISTTTTAEDDTTTRNFALTINAKPQVYTTHDGAKDRYTWAILNSVDDATDYGYIVSNGVPSTIFVPDHDYTPATPSTP